MAVDRRRRDVNWNVVDEAGGWYPGDYGGASLAVLMDIRDELQRLNALLHCSNFTTLPATVRALNRKIRDPKRRRTS